MAAPITFAPADAKELSDLYKAINPPSNGSFAYTLIAALVTGVALVIITMCGIYAAQMGTTLYLPALLPSIAAIVCMIPFIIVSVMHESRNNTAKTNLENKLRTILAPLEGQQKTKDELIAFMKDYIFVDSHDKNNLIARYQKEYLIGRLQALLPKEQFSTINDALADIQGALYPKDGDK